MKTSKIINKSIRMNNNAMRTPVDSTACGQEWIKPIQIQRTVIEYVQSSPTVESIWVWVRTLCVSRWKFLCTQRIMHAVRFRDVLLPLSVAVSLLNECTIYIKLMPPKYHWITGTTFQSTLFGYSCSCLYNFSSYYYYFTPSVGSARCWMHW